MLSSVVKSLRLASVAASAVAMMAMPHLAHADVTIDAEEWAVVDLINAERALLGLSAVGLDDRLSALADQHSADMALSGCFQHDSCDGTSWVTRMQSGYPTAGIGEIIAAGYSNAASVVQAWMESPGHKAQILTAGYQALGVGLIRGGSYGTYWTVDFGSLPPESATSVPEPGTWMLLGLGLLTVAAVRRKA